MLVYCFGLLYCILNCICHALPVKQGVPQVAFYLEKTEPFENKPQHRSEEYILYTEIVRHYENLVDTALNAQSEELLLYLIYMPTDSKYQLLEAQVRLLGIDQAISKKQLLKIPSIISKHVQTMNAQVYESIHSTIQRHWKTLWEDAFSSPDTAEPGLSNLLSSFNSILATKLVDQMDEYMLVERVQESIRTMIQDTTQATLLQSWSSRLPRPFSFLPTLYPTQKTTTITFQLNPSISQEIDIDFLRQHVAGLRISLLTELHLQFMNLSLRMKTDVIEQLNNYYNEL
ncbi:hypothetical protein BD560DRAFT_350805 [Blakeslea trispora]|nr:hypothetical protein BD560DRAFT_350805 [Blakeslea trispora]